MSSKSGGERGFTLLEVIVALIIAASALTVMFSSLETGLWSEKQADSMLQAVSIARSQLEATLASPRLHIGTSDYVIDQLYRTAIDVRQISSSPSLNGAPQPALYDVSVTVTWGVARRSIRLSGRAVRPGSANE
jgi:prepilin-type N-terminal cleavage/methylation domain-containing protein